MKILITTDIFHTDANGVATSVKNLCEELEKKGHDVRVLTLSDRRKSFRDGKIYYIKSISLGIVYPGIRAAVSYRGSLVEELMAWRPDVIHSQCEFFTFQFAKRISKAVGAPIIHTYHTLYEQYIGYVFPLKRLGARTIGALSCWRLRDVSSIIVPTRKVENVLRGYGLTKPVHVVPTGIDLERHRLPMTKQERDQRRFELGIGADAQVVINLGRMGIEKNLEELIRLFADTASRNSRLVLLLVGDGPDRLRLERLTAELGISESVLFTGMVPPCEVQYYYQLGDVFASASTSETQGLTYIEAAANALPLLCRQDPCLRGVIEEGVNGYEYTAPEDFRCRLKAMLEDEGWRKAAGEHSKRIAKNFGKEQFGINIEKVYKSALQESDSYIAGGTRLE